MGFGTIFRYGPSFGDIVDFQVVNQLPMVTAVGQPGTNYILEHTFQLGPPALWRSVTSTNAPADGRFDMQDLASPVGASQQQSFYRLRW